MNKGFFFSIFLLFINYDIFSRGSILLSPGDTLDIVIGLPNLTADDRDAVISKLNSESISVVGYCTNLEILILRGYNFKTKEFFFDECRKTLTGFHEIIFKEGVITEIIAQCVFSEKRDEALIKKLRH
jgi:hypothetical protein